MMPTEQSATFQAQTLLCRECGRDFLWSAEEQQRFAELGLKNTPKRCRGCRTRKPAQPIPQQEMVRGKVKWFNVTKGFGFIIPDDKTKGEVYVHFSQIYGRGFMSLAPGQIVEFAIVQAERGPAAVNVRAVEAQ